MDTFPSSYAAGSVEEAAAQRKDRVIARAIFGSKEPYGRNIDRAFGEGDVRTLPRFNQSQQSLDEQLRVLYDAANRLGLYDAASHIRGSK